MMQGASAMKCPKVSVVVPVYNTEKYLRKCLDSLVNQTLEELEIIVVDDGSTDGSVDILKEYQTRYSDRFFVICKENEGQGIARNIGIKECSGEYIGFMDSDDYLELDMYEKMYEAAQTESADFAECRYRYVCCDNEIQEELNTYGSVRPYKNQKDMFLNPLVSPWNKLYKREVFEQSASLFTEGVIYEDTAFFIKQIPFIKKSVHLEEAFVTHILRGSSTMSINKSKRVGDIFTVLEDILAFYEQKGIRGKYEKELEYFCVKILLCSSLERISKVKDKKLRKQFLEETNRVLVDCFRGYRRNPYMRKGLKNAYMKFVAPWNIGLVCFCMRFVSKV